MYKCEICGKEHSNITDRAKCELDCAKRIEEDAKKAAEAKKKEEQEIRRTEVEQAVNHAKKLLMAYINDYKSFEFSADEEEYPFWTSKLLSWFV